MRALELELLPGRFAVARLEPDSVVPPWAAGDFVSVSKTPEELTVVCEEDRVPGKVRCERGWRAFRVRGTLDFGETGVLAALAAPLADAGVPVFAVSTYDTDYVLVRESDLEGAANALRAAGHHVAGR